MRVEVDDSWDAQHWGINHYTIFHPAPSRS